MLGRFTRPPKSASAGSALDYILRAPARSPHYQGAALHLCLPVNSWELPYSPEYTHPTSRVMRCMLPPIVEVGFDQFAEKVDCVEEV